MGDFSYRSREEVEEWKKRCPIPPLRDPITKDAGDNGQASRLEAVDSEITALVAEAVKFAENSPWPEPKSATEHVYAAPNKTSPAPPAAGREISFLKATHEALAAEMAQNPTIFVLGEGI